MSDPTSIDPIAYIIGALSAGAATVGKTTCQEVVKDSYKALKSKLQKWFLEKEYPDGEMVLARYESKPEKWEAILKDSLSETASAKNEDILKAAKDLVEALKNTEEGKKAVSQVNLTNCQVGNIVEGDNVTITGDFNFGIKS